MIVLSLAVVSFSIGTAYLEAYSSVVPEAENEMAASRAKYLAGSGVDIACHYLLYPPSSVASGAYWLGGKGINVDATSDYVNVRVNQDAGNPDIYQVDSFGIAHDKDGTARGKRGVRARVMMRPDDMIEIPYAIQGGGTLGGDSSVHVAGDMYAQGYIMWDGDCSGNVSSSSVIIWTSYPFPASRSSYVAKVPTPTVDLSVYGDYVVNGEACKAYQFNSSKMTAIDAASLNSLLDSAKDNPGRIVVAKPGNFDLMNGLDFNGTLVIDGDLHMKDPGTYRLVAVMNYPAIVCTKEVKIDSDSTRIAIRGVTLCQRLNLNRKDDLRVVVDGALVTTGDDGIKDENGSNVDVTLTYNSAYAKYYDFSRTAMPYTLLSWTDY